MLLQNVFIHHVFFWLKENNEQNRNQLIEGLQKLSSVTTIRQYQIGIPANTNREVIENGYSVSWTLIFDTPQQQESYQEDPVHLDFVKACSPLWNKVIVFDTVNAL
ncbi:MAG: Dabb family protein [Bacteroidetes bacterium]|nr:Dabb family protein [Bacteroidota bacterium]